MYDFLKGFRVHADEEQTIDDFPELALNNIAAHDFFAREKIRKFQPAGCLSLPMLILK